MDTSLSSRLSLRSKWRGPRSAKVTFTNTVFMEFNTSLLNYMLSCFECNNLKFLKFWVTGSMFRHNYCLKSFPTLSSYLFRLMEISSHLKDLLEPTLKHWLLITLLISLKTRTTTSILYFIKKLGAFAAFIQSRGKGHSIPFCMCIRMLSYNYEICSHG